MRFDILTLFPELFGPYLDESVLGRAVREERIEVHLHDIRDEAEGRHRDVDDAPYGGGEGMVLSSEPLARSIRKVQKATPPGRVLFLTPQGRPLDHAMACRLAAEPRLILLCGRYEGIDERVRESLIDEEVSIGDYVLTGGELPALVLIDAVSRLLPGVVGNPDSVAHDSLTDGLLKYPQYTRPRVFEGMAVPEILLSGDHQAIARWRREQCLARTLRTRPELLERAHLTPADRETLARLGGSSHGTNR